MTSLSTTSSCVSHHIALPVIFLCLLLPENNDVMIWLIVFGATIWLISMDLLWVVPYFCKSQSSFRVSSSPNKVGHVPWHWYFWWGHNFSCSEGSFTTKWHGNWLSIDSLIEYMFICPQSWSGLHGVSHLSFADTPPSRGLCGLLLHWLLLDISSASAIYIQYFNCVITTLKILLYFWKYEMPFLLKSSHQQRRFYITNRQRNSWSLVHHWHPPHHRRYTSQDTPGIRCMRVVERGVSCIH